MRILIYSAEVVDDLGGPSIVSGFCKMTRRNLAENVQIDLLTETVNEKTITYLNELNVGYIEYRDLFAKRNIIKIVRSVFNINKKSVLQKKDFVEGLIARISKYDCLVDMGGICFTDNIPQKNLIRTIYQKIAWIVAKKLHLKVVLYTTSIGPINTFKTKYGSRFLLKNYCDFVMLRENRCKEIYEGLKVKTPYVVCPDTAFAFVEKKPVGEQWEEFANKSRKVGVSLSFQLMKQTPGYFEVMEDVCRYLVEEGNNVLLIANECSGHEESDDRFVVRKMAERLGNDNVLMADPVDMNGENLKWLVSKCDVVISSRYHTLMAAISTCVPSIALSWHYKYREALTLVGLEGNVVENTSFSAAKIIEMFEKTMKQHIELSEKMKTNVDCVKSQVLMANKDFCNILMKTK